jgi:regulatory protein
MKIGKYTKMKSNKYKVEIDGEVIKLYDDVIVKYELLRKKEIDEDLFDEIVEYNDGLEAYYKALKYITNKMRTEKEIHDYLRKDYSRSVVANTIDRLKENGYINKELYLKAFLNDRVNLSNDGPNKIRKDLIKLGYSEDEIRNPIDKIDDNVWLDKIDGIVKRKIKSNKSYGNNKLKEKIHYELSNLGYYKWMIDDIIFKNDFTIDDNIIRKEYNKLYTRLSKKYEGSNLDYQIKMKLLQKGFYLEDVEKVIKE